MSREQRAWVEALLRQPRPGGVPTVEGLREGFRQLMASMRVPGGIRTRASTLGGRPALVVEPEGHERSGTLLYFHGGGFFSGSPETALALTGSLVARTGVRAVSVDYRLAPEHPFPAAIEDTVSAYRTLLENGEKPGEIVIAGDSAGGGLAVTTCLAARDAGLPMPAGIVAFSPGLDHSRTGASMTTRAGLDPIFTPETLARSGAWYLAGQDPAQPLLSPAVHAEPAGLPPMLLQAGTNELLLDDATRLAARARDAGVDVILDIVADVPHVFQAFTGVLDEADEALDRAALFITQRLAGPR